MTRTRWHILEEDQSLTVARQVPARFDVAASAEFPVVGSDKALAMQIRQDMWRMLRDVRGFSPVVQVQSRSGGLTVTAGGRIARPAAPDTVARIASMLARPDLRARWIAHASRRSGTSGASAA